MHPYCLMQAAGRRRLRRRNARGARPGRGRPPIGPPVRRQWKNGAVVVSDPIPPTKKAHSSVIPVVGWARESDNGPPKGPSIRARLRRAPAVPISILRDRFGTPARSLPAAGVARSSGRSPGVSFAGSFFQTPIGLLPQRRPLSRPGRGNFGLRRGWHRGVFECLLAHGNLTLLRAWRMRGWLWPIGGELFRAPESPVAGVQAFL